jgi:uncharacterized Tic20 family protein
MLSNHHKNVAAVIHLSALSKFIFPLGNFIMPLIFWTMNKDKSEFVDKHGKQAINFQLSILLYTFLIGSITIPLFLFGVLNHIDFPEFWQAYDFDFDFHLSSHDSYNVIIFSILAGLLVIAAFVLEIIFIIIATSKANQGEPYKYPLTINFLK